MRGYSWGAPGRSAFGAGGAGWLVFTDSELNTRQRLLGQGQSSLIISASSIRAISRGELVTRPLTLYVRGDEQVLARRHLQGLLLSQGSKIQTTLVKHHHRQAYRLMPNNAQPALALLSSLIPPSHPVTGLARRVFNNQMQVLPPRGCVWIWAASALGPGGQSLSYNPARKGLPSDGGRPHMEGWWGGNLLLRLWWGGGWMGPKRGP